MSRESKEIFKVGDTVTWGDYVGHRWVDPTNGTPPEGPFVITEVKDADSPHVGHPQLVKVKGYDWFSGLWFTIIAKPKSKYRRIEL